MLSAKNKTHFKYKDTGRLKLKDCRKINCVNTNQNIVEIIIVTGDYVNFRKINIISDKEEHYVMIEE